MTLYEFFKFLHVSFAIAWLGGGLAMIILSISAQRKRDYAETLTIIRYVVALATRLFIPASGGAFLSGVAMMLVTPMWGQAWIIFGIVGFATTFSVGNWILRPRADELVALEAREGVSANVIALGNQMLSISKFDYIMLFTIVADMVIKPLWSEWYVILVFLLVIAAAAWFFLVPVLRPQVAARA